MISEQTTAEIMGKMKQIYEKKGIKFTRKGYSLRAEIASRFAKKCALLNEPEGRVVQRLIEAFCYASGWGNETKQGAFFETRSSEHIKDAVEVVVKDSIIA